MFNVPKTNDCFEQVIASSSLYVGVLESKIQIFASLKQVGAYASGVRKQTLRAIFLHSCDPNHANSHPPEQSLEPLLNKKSYHQLHNLILKIQSAILRSTQQAQRLRMSQHRTFLHGFRISFIVAEC